MADPIVYDVESGIGVLRVNRPEARNALNWQAQESFARVVDAAAEDRNLRVFIIIGTGRAFVAGGDLKELAQDAGLATGDRLNRIMSGALAQLASLEVPVIAAVNGDAAGGGCEIMAACDLRLAASKARLRFVQVQMGLTTGWGGTARLVNLLGESKAMEILLTGATVTAEEAHTLGFVHRLVPEGEDVLAAALDWAGELRALPREALAAIKRLVRASSKPGARAATEYERELFLSLWGEPDHREAVHAFLEKRRPRFGQAKLGS